MKKWLLILLLLPAFLTGGRAEAAYEDGGTLVNPGSLEADLSEEERQINGELRLDGSYDSEGALRRLWESFLMKLRENLRQELGFALRLLVVALLIALAQIFCAQEGIDGTIQIIGCGALAMLMAGGMDSVMAQADDVLTRLSDYSRAALPTMFTAAAACGAVGTASARYAACALAMEFLISTGKSLVIPLIHAFLAVSISQSAFDNSILQAVSRLLKWGITMGMTALTLAFSAYISMTGVISGSVNALAMKAAKTAISTSLPVVGGILADSASVALKAAALIKNSAGVFGLIAVCTLCLGPVALLIVKLFLYKAVAAAIGMLPGKRIASLVDNFGTAFAMLLGLVGSSAMMLFVSFVSGIKVTAAT